MSYSSSTAMTINNPQYGLKVPTREHLGWISLKPDGGVCMTDFVACFGYKDRKEAESAFFNLITCNSTSMKKEKRRELVKEFETWNTRHGDAYWSERKLQDVALKVTTDTTILLMQRAGDLACSALKAENRVHPRSDDDEEEASATTSGRSHKRSRMTTAPSGLTETDDDGTSSLEDRLREPVDSKRGIKENWTSD
ncbi:MAG: hypothetical protein J3Q66DRAFT_321421 [Benniella sp.]|nr:MAG: hypothetical protein J3Q66DRAFT_321421 [Benniella sp.]